MNNKIKQIILLSMIICFYASQSIAGTEFLPVPLEGHWKPKTIEVNQKNEISACLFLLPTNDLDNLSVSIKIPKNIELISGETTIEYRNVKANQEIKIKLTFSVLASDELDIIASAVLSDTPEVKIGKAFVLKINPISTENTETQLSEDEDGNKLIIY